MRWLGVEQPLYDHAYVRVSNNGTTWSTIWQNTEEVYDGAWVSREFDISSIADGNQVYVRFTMGTTDGAWTYCGWNIDNFKVVGYECDQTQMAIVTNDVPDWTMGVTYFFQLEAVGGTGIKTWSDMNGDLIGTGLTLLSDGLLSGIPSTAGSILFTAMLTDEDLNTVDKEFSFIINSELDITTTAISDATEGKLYSFTMQCTGGTGAKTWSDLNNDLNGTGLILSASGMISGSPSAYGDFDFTAHVEDAVGDIDENLCTITINPVFVCGDLDDNGDINVLDIVFLIDFKFKNGPAPEPMQAADVNSDGEVNVLDIVWLIDYKFKGGAAPDCP